MIINLFLKNPRLLRVERQPYILQFLSPKLNISEDVAFLCLNAATEEILAICSPDQDTALKRALHDREYLVSFAKGSKDLKGNTISRQNLDLVREFNIEGNTFFTLYVVKS